MDESIALACYMHFKSLQQWLSEHVISPCDLYYIRREQETTSNVQTVKRIHQLVSAIILKPWFSYATFAIRWKLFERPIIPICITLTLIWAVIHRNSVCRTDRQNRSSFDTLTDELFFRGRLQTICPDWLEILLLPEGVSELANHLQNKTPIRQKKISIYYLETLFTSQLYTKYMMLGNAAKAAATAIVDLLKTTQNSSYT